ncbi:MAG: hypothetical protein GEU28_01435 [Dehalococcoidia bacterium]|nr:hypothetical protein [Dehalococcoidia bacterium]
METHNTDERQLLRSLEEAEVIAVRFTTIPQRLLIDLRTSEIDGPMIKVLPRARSAEERVRTLKKLRPRFKLPRKIAGVSWPRFVRSLEEQGGADAIVNQMAIVGGVPAARAAREAVDELLLLERREIYKAIKGEDYRTLWELA